MTSPIFLSPPDIGDDERRAVARALDSGWVAPAGPELDAFEAELADRAGRRHAVAVSSGTAGLHLLAVALEVGPESEVVLPTLNFVAAANSISYVGATPRFIDSEPDSWNLDPELLAGVLDHGARIGTLPAMVIAVDLYGSCASYDDIVRVCAEHDVVLVEDAAEALGATHSSRPAGSFGIAGVFSFNGNKIVTTSGGGAVVTDDDVLAARVRHLANQAREPVRHYEHIDLGYNYRLSNVLAALGRAQLARLDELIARRANIEARYRGALESVPGVELIPRPASGSTNHWLTCCTIDRGITGVSRDQLIDALGRADIEARPTWKPMHLQPLYKMAPTVLTGLADRIFDQGLCLPSGSGLTPDEQDRVIDVLRSTLDGAQR